MYIQSFLQNNFLKNWRKKGGFETAPVLKLLKKYSFGNGKGLEKSFRFDAAVVFKYTHTDEADTVTNTLDTAVSLLDTAKFVGPQFCFRNWYVSCSQEASFRKIPSLPFTPSSTAASGLSLSRLAIFVSKWLESIVLYCLLSSAHMYRTCTLQ